MTNHGRLAADGGPVAPVERPIISLLPLTSQHHIEALQGVYRATPGYWRMYNIPSSPFGQAALDLRAAEATPGRALMGIIRHLAPSTLRAGTEMIGLVDFRLYWPRAEMAYLGMVMVAEPYQRRGVGTQAWSLLKPWLADSAKVATVRLGVEQFNLVGLKFFASLGFQLTGETNRVRVGDKLVRLLYMELAL